MTSPGARAVLYQTIWRDFHLVRGHGFAHPSFWITKECRIQLITFLQTLKYARPDKSNAMQRNLTLESNAKTVCPQSTLELSTIAMLVFHINFKFPNTVFMIWLRLRLRLIHLNDHCSITL